jgi:hypothetical protein
MFSVVDAVGLQDKEEGLLSSMLLEVEGTGCW